MIGDRPADLITTCLGINVHGNGTFNARSFFPAVAGFLSTIRDRHPEAPILVITPIISPEREESPNSAGLTLSEIRGEVAAAVEALRRHGDANLHLLNGLDVIGLGEEAVLFDGLHPDAKGYELMASKIKPVVADLLR
jgi:lysophospholipase L1-like esterase